MANFPLYNKNNIKIIAKRISNSKKEIEIALVSDVLSNYENSNFPIFLPNQNTIQTFSAGQIFAEFNTLLTAIIAAPKSDVVLDVGNGKYIPIVNTQYTEDLFLPVNDTKRTMLVIRTNEALPASIKKLSEIKIKIIHSELTSENIVYGGAVKEKTRPFGTPLNVDYSDINTNPSNDKTSGFESYNELTASIGVDRLDETMSGSLYNDIVDFSTFDNFVHFSSAEKRIINFKQKVTDIQTYFSDISSSLIGAGQNLPIQAPAADIGVSHIINSRKEKFSKAQQIINSFTAYERYLYFDNQETNSGSVPGLGENYANYFPITTGTDRVVRYNNDGFDTTFVISGSQQEVNLTSGIYKAEDPPFFNSSGSFYLSFLMRASKSISDNLVFENYQTSSVPVYPQKSMHNKIIEKPDASGSRYQRYIFETSASYWEPTSDATIPGLASTGVIDFDSTSTDYRILSGSNISGSGTRKGYGLYSKYIYGPETGSGTGIVGSFLPKGDLFNIKIKETLGEANENIIITDFKITQAKPDENYLPFSYIPNVSSPTFNNWYTDMITLARNYDDANINRLLHNTPSEYQDRDDSNNVDLRDFIDMIGEFFDEYKILIDDYFRIFNKGFSDYETLPNKFNGLLSQWVGFDIIEPQSGSLLDNFGLDAYSSKDKTKFYTNLANRVLNNISYLYKTKGTKNSITGLMNVYGLPSNVLRLREAGASTKKYYDSILSNEVTNTSYNVSEQTGSSHYAVSTTEFISLIPHPEMSMSVTWNATNEYSQSAIEGVFKLFPTANTMSLMEDRADNNSDIKWRLIAMQSSSNQPNTAKLRFQVNTSTNATASIDSRSEFIETDFLNIMDNSLINILLQKSSSGHNVVDDHKYELIVGKSSTDGIEFIHKTSQLEAAGDDGGELPINKNFLSGSSNRLHLVNDYTGSVAQIKAWTEPLSISSFKQHILNKKSKVGNKLSSSIEELVIDLTLDENYQSGSDKFDIVDSSTKGPDQSLSLALDIIDSSYGTPYDSDIITTFNFPGTGAGLGTLEFDDNNIIIDNNFELTDNLSWEKSALKSNKSVLNKDFIHTNNLEFARSPQEVINDFIIDNVGHFDYNDLFADPQDDFANTYKDLDAFNKKILADNGVSVNVNNFIRATSKIFKGNLVKDINSFLPARAKVTKGTIIKPTLVERLKFPPLSTQPNIEHIHKEETTIEGEKHVNYGGEVLTPAEFTFDNSSPFDNNIYNSNVFETGEIDLYYQLGVPKRRENPENSWGTSSNDTHFVNKLQPGIADDGNTFHYEERAVFEMIGDSEFVSGSKIGKSHIFHIDYTDSKTFDNKKLIKTSEVVGKRAVGTTLQFISVDSSSYGELLDDTYRYPTNHLITYGGNSHFQVNRGFFSGYQFEGSALDGFGTSPSTIPLSWTATGIIPVYNDTVTPIQQGIDFEDLTTASFYTIALENDSRLRIIRETDQGNITT